MSDEEEVEYDIVMPFIACESKGGPYDDESYVAGWELGRIDMQMAVGKVMPEYVEILTVHTANLGQLDLLAMRHEYLVQILERDACEGWSTVRIRSISKDRGYEQD